MATAEETYGAYWWRHGHGSAPGKVNVGKPERVISGALGALMATAGLRRQGWQWKVVGLAGVALGMRAATGHSVVYELAGVSSAGLGEGAGISVDENVTVNKPVAEVFAFFDRTENLGAATRHVRWVARSGPDRTRWELEAKGRTLGFEAEVIERIPDAVIAWHSLPGSDVEHAGSVRFRPALGGAGTEVQLKLRYTPVDSMPEFAVARVTAPAVRALVTEELRRVKAVLEAGEAPTIEGQTSARREDRVLVSAQAPSAPIGNDLEP